MLTVHCTVGTRWCSSFPFPRQHSSILTSFIQHLTRPSLCHGCISGQCHSDTTSGWKCFNCNTNVPYNNGKSFCKRESNALQTEEFWWPQDNICHSSQKDEFTTAIFLQQYFTIIYMKTPIITELEVTLKTDEIPFFS